MVEVSYRTLLTIPTEILTDLAIFAVSVAALAEICSYEVQVMLAMLWLVS